MSQSRQNSTIISWLTNNWLVRWMVPWVTHLQRQWHKDEVKRSEGPPTRIWGPEGHRLLAISDVKNLLFWRQKGWSSSVSDTAADENDYSGGFCSLSPANTVSLVFAHVLWGRKLKSDQCHSAIHREGDDQFTFSLFSIMETGIWQYSG